MTGFKLWLNTVEHILANDLGTTPRNVRTMTNDFKMTLARAYSAGFTPEAAVDDLRMVLR